MLLTVVSILALAAAFAYLLWSVGSQYPDRTLRGADRPDREERILRYGADLGPPRRRLGPRSQRASPPDPQDPGLPTGVSVDRGIAVMLIEEAAAAGAAGRQIVRAARQVARGDRYASAGRHEDALKRYGRAWNRASRALEEIRG